MSLNNITVWSTKLILSDVIIRKDSGIYKITNLLDGKAYIGSAVNLRYRNIHHYRSLMLNKHHSIKLQRAWNKYGEENFKFEIIEVIEDKSQLISREQYYIDFLKPFYNTAKIAGSQLGYKHTVRTKELLSINRKNKMSKGEIVTWNKGLSLPPRTQSTKDKISLTTRGVKKKPFTEKHIDNLSIAAKKRSIEKPLPKESIQKGIDKRKSNPNYSQICKNRQAKTAESNKKKVYQLNPQTNEIIKIFNSNGEVMRYFDITSDGHIKKAAQANRIYKGFKWKYENRCSI